MVNATKEFVEEREKGDMTEKSPSSSKRRRRYEVDREKALGVVIGLGLLWLVGAIVGAFIPDLYAIPVILIVYLVLLIVVTRKILPRLSKRKPTTPNGTPEEVTE